MTHSFICNPNNRQPREQRIIYRISYTCLTWLENLLGRLPNVPELCSAPTLINISNSEETDYEHYYGY